MTDKPFGELPVWQRALIAAFILVWVALYIAFMGQWYGWFN